MSQSVVVSPDRIAPGTKLPDFSVKLATKDGLVDFKLSEHLGKGPIVFAFFPLAFTGGCTKEMCEVRDNFGSFGSLNAQVFGFSADTGPANRAFLEKEGLQFGILSDPNRQFIGRVWPAMATPVLGVDNVAQRGAMVVNPDGTVKWASASPDTKVWVGVDEIRKHLA